MKTIQQADLARVALAKGATIKLDGRQINAAAERVDMPRPHLVAKPSAPEPVPAPAPPPPAIDTSGLEQAALATQRSTEQLVQVIAMLVQEVRAGQQHPPRHGWNFEVQRDAAGRLTNIKARPLAEGE
jgi:hypothetical protein